MIFEFLGCLFFYLFRQAEIFFRKSSYFLFLPQTERSYCRAVKGAPALQQECVVLADADSRTYNPNRVNAPASLKLIIIGQKLEI